MSGAERIAALPIERPKFLEASSAPLNPWQEPTPLNDLGQLPSFPVEQLPDALREWVVAESVATQTPVDLAAMLALAAISAAVPAGSSIQVTESWSEPVALWTAVALRSGERKSAVLSDAKAPLSQLEQECQVNAQSQIVAHNMQVEVQAERLKKAKRAAVADPSRMADAQAAAIELDELERDAPTLPRFYTSDTTPEALTSLQAANGGKSAIFSAEGGIFGIMAGRYSDGAGGNLDPFLNGHAGDEVRVDRKNGPPLIIEKSVLSMGLAVQPSVIQGLASNPNFRGTGLLARFLYAIPTSLVGHREINPPSVPERVSGAYAEIFRRIHRQGPVTVRFAPEAVEALNEFRRELEPRLGENGDLFELSDWANKLPGAIARIAAILTLADGGFECFESFVLRAIFMTTYLLENSKAAFCLMGSTGDNAEAEKLLRWIKRQEKREFTKRDCHQANRSHFKKVEQIDAPLNLLCEHGYLRMVEQAAPTNGRPKGPVFEVNPLTHSQKTQKAQNSLN